MPRMVLIFFILLNVSFAQETDNKVRERDIDVAVGIDEIIQLDYKFNTKVQIGNESLLQLILSPSKREVTFRGVKAGKTSVTVRDTFGEIRDKFIVNITAEGLSKTVRELRELIGDIEGIEIGIKGGKVIIEGEIIVPSDIGRIATVLAAYQDVLPLIEMSPQTQRIIARKMQEEINRNNMKDVTVRVVNGDYWIEGVVNSADKKTLAENIAKAYLPDNVQSLASSAGGQRFQGKQKGNFLNFISVNEKKDPEPPPKLIKVAAQFVELAKDYQKVFGFKWAPLMTQSGSISFGKTTEGGITTEESGTLSGTISNLFPKLSSAKGAGYARVIQSGMVLTQENKNATVKKSQEIPYAVGSGEFQQAGQAKIEFNMSVTPSVGDKENVNLSDLSISVALPGSSTSENKPTSIQNSITTNLVVKSKESAVIGGIVQNSSTTSYDKADPTGGAGQQEEGTSFLFNLLRSKSYITGKSQFVVFITPEIVQSASVGTEDIRKKFRKRAR